ncbi:MAG: response regulator [Betaproteobacteria bacterium]|nr:response regulator [Betaproteobacteria bacterium]
MSIADTRKRILIVDNEESMRPLLGRTVEALPNVEITLAGTCEEALHLAGSRGYDVILLDLLMPGVGGIEVLKTIRNASPNKQTPVIIVSVMADEDTKIVCRSLGISDYIVKPIVRESLVTVVKARIEEPSKPAAAPA